MDNTKYIFIFFLTTLWNLINETANMDFTIANILSLSRR